MEVTYIISVVQYYLYINVISIIYLCLIDDSVENTENSPESILLFSSIAYISHVIMENFCPLTHVTSDYRVLSCLMAHMDSNKMTDDCEERLMEVQYFIARDFR